LATYHYSNHTEEVEGGRKREREKKRERERRERG